MNDPVVWGQILIAIVSGLFTVIGGVIVIFQRRSAAYWKRELEEQRLKGEQAKAEADRKLEQQRAELEQAKAEAQAAIIRAQAFASERILAAEGEVRSIADQHAILTQMITLLSESGRRQDEKDARTLSAMNQLLDASRESTDTLKIHNQHFTSILRDLTRVQTDLGEGVSAIRLLEQTVSSLPGHFDTRTNPLVEAITAMLQRVNELIGTLDASKQQMANELIAAIRAASTETVRETVAALALLIQPPTQKLTEESP